MFKKSVRILIHASFVLCLTVSCFAQKQNVYRSPEGHFSFVIPEGWQEIPREAIIEKNKEADQYLEKIIKSYGKSGHSLTKSTLHATTTDAGFQKINDKYFSKPFMLLSIEKSDIKEPQRYLKFYLKTKEYKKLKVELKDKPNPAFLDFVQLGEFKYDDVREEMYDANTNMFITTSASFPIFKNIGRIRSIHIKALYKYGAVHLSFQTTEKDFDNDIGYLEQIVNSFKFDEDYRYPGGTK